MEKPCVGVVEFYRRRDPCVSLKATKSGARGLGISSTVNPFLKDNQGEQRLTLLRTLLLGSLNVRGCSSNEAKRREIDELFVRRKFDVLALNETKLKGMGNCDSGVVNGRKSGVEEG